MEKDLDTIENIVNNEKIPKKENLSYKQYIEEVSDKFLTTSYITNPLSAYLDTYSKIYNDHILNVFKTSPFSIMSVVIKKLDYDEYKDLDDVLYKSGVKFNPKNNFNDEIYRIKKKFGLSLDKEITTKFYYAWIIMEDMNIDDININSPSDYDDLLDRLEKYDNIKRVQDLRMTMKMINNEISYEDYVLIINHISEIKENFIDY